MYPRQKSINHGFLFHFRWQCKTGKITMRELVLLSTMMLILISWCEMHGSCSYTCKSLPRGATFHSECEYTGTCILEVNLHWMYTPILHIKMRTDWQIFFSKCWRPLGMKIWSEAVLFLVLTARASQSSSFHPNAPFPLLTFLSKGRMIRFHKNI